MLVFGSMEDITNDEYLARSYAMEGSDLPTSFGRRGLQNNPSGALMPGKVIGCGWTNVLTWLRWELNTSLMPFASTHEGPGGQPQSKLWASLLAVCQRMPIRRTCM